MSKRVERRAEVKQHHHRNLVGIALREQAGHDAQHGGLRAVVLQIETFRTGYHQKRVFVVALKQLLFQKLEWKWQI